MILVTGATGTVGRHVVELLVKHGKKVKALTRNPDKAVLPSEAEAVRGDLASAESMQEAWGQVEGMFLITSSDQSGAYLQTDPQIIAHAKAAGVKRVVVLVGYEEGPVEAALKSSGMQWTFLKPGEFMANALDDWGEMIRSEGVVREFGGNALSAKIHERDIAEVAVTCLLEKGLKHHRQSYYLTGPEAITRRQSVQIISKQLGKEIPFIELTEEEARRNWREQGYDEESIDFFVQMGSNPPEVGYTVLPTVEQVTGRPAATFAAWVEEHKDEWI